MRLFIRIQSRLVLLHLVSLLRRRQLGARAQDMAVLEHDKGNDGQEGSDARKQETGPLAAEVDKELVGEEGGDAAERVTHETLAGNRRRRILAVAVRRETIRGLEDEEDARGDGGEGDGGRDPREVAVLREAVDEEAEGQEAGSPHGAVEARFGQDDAVARSHDGFVFADLEKVQAKGDSDADAERDVWEAGNAFVPTPLGLKGDGDDRQEQERHEPGKSDPKTKGEHDGFGHQHVDRLDRRVVQHLLDIFRFQVHGGSVSFVVRCDAKCFGSFVQCNSSSRLTKEDANNKQERDVCQSLNSLNPSPFDGEIDESRVNGSRHRPEDGNV